METYTTKLLLEKNYDFSKVFSEKQEYLKGTQDFSFGLPQVVNLLKEQSQNFTSSNPALLSLDKKIQKLVEKYQISINAPMDISVTEDGVKPAVPEPTAVEMNPQEKVDNLEARIKLLDMKLKRAKTDEEKESLGDRKKLLEMALKSAKKKIQKELGGNVSTMLQNFDLDMLDDFEAMQYEHHTKEAGLTKEGALQVIINSVEGDYSQLSPELANIAELQMPSTDWDKIAMEHYGYCDGGKFAKGGRLCPVGTKIQTLIFNKENFTKKEAVAWARKHGKNTDVDEKENTYRLRQIDPEKLSDMKTITFKGVKGIQAVIGCPAKKHADGGNVPIYYEAEYYARVGEHGHLGDSSDFDTEWEKALDLYKRTKKEKGLGSDLTYIGVNGNDKFGIVYIHEDYLRDTSGGDFRDEHAYEAWVDAAKKVIKTGKPVKSKYPKEFAEGGKFKDFLNKAKAQAKTGYEKSKEAVEEKIHDKKEKVAVAVLHETGKKTQGRDLSAVKQAIAVVRNKYTKGGYLNDKEYEAMQVVEDKWFDILAGMSKEDKECPHLQEMNRISKKAATKENLKAFKTRASRLKNKDLKKYLNQEIKIIESGKTGFKNKFGGYAGKLTKLSAASHLFDIFRQGYNY